MGNTPVVAKQDIAKYVKDMAEIEAAEFTLRKAAEEMRKDAEWVQRKNESEVHTIERDLTSIIQDQTEAQAFIEGKQPLKPPSPPPPLPDPPVEPACWKEYQNKNLQEKELVKPTYKQYKIRAGICIFIGIIPVLLLTAYLAYAISIVYFIAKNGSIDLNATNVEIPDSEITMIVGISLVVSFFLAIIIYSIIAFLICRAIANYRYGKAITEYNHNAPIKAIGDEYYEKKQIFDRKHQEHEKLTAEYRRLYCKYEELSKFEDKTKTEIRSRTLSIKQKEESLSLAQQQQ
ncbi:MAG: hypothetical protein IJN34_03630, partial [Clostridia bacterium]|nr:hypothetical protein [Clostridia bacterium]